MCIRAECLPLKLKHPSPEPRRHSQSQNQEWAGLNSTIPRSKRLCAHCGASSMSASAVALVVFDLDACCWYPEMYQLWVRGQIANPGLRTHVHGSRYKGATPCHSVPLRVTRAAAHRFRKKRQHQTTRCTTPPVVACDCLPMWHCAGLTATNGRRGARSLSVWPAAAMSPHGGASVCRNSSSNLGLR